MKRCKQFRRMSTLFLACTMALTGCAGLSSQNTFPQTERIGDYARGASSTTAQFETRRTANKPRTWDADVRVASGYFHGIDCCGENRVAFIRGPEVPSVSALPYAPNASEVLRVDLMQVVFQFATQP